MAAMLMAGALLWLIPYLRAPHTAIAGVPAPAPLLTVANFEVAPHRQACMTEVAVEPNSRLAELHLLPAKPGRAGPPVRLVLIGHDYRASVDVPGGYPGGAATLPLKPGPPKRSLLVTACFQNIGTHGVDFVGSTEARTMTRSALTVDGKPTLGDIMLTFYDSGSQSLLDQLGETFSHASNLTAGLVPVWLVWIIAIAVALGIPGGMMYAIYMALREEDVDRDSQARAEMAPVATP